MRRMIETEHVRRHELTDQAIPCRSAVNEHHSPYGVKAHTGDWIVYREQTDGTTQRVCVGRMLGRVNAPDASSERFNIPAVDGYLSVLALADNHTHAFIRWINPEDVLEVHPTPPSAMLAFISGPLPNADIIHKLSHYGTLSETYIGNVPHHVKAFEHGVSPCAWDHGTRRTEHTTCKDASCECRQTTGKE